MSKFTPAKLYGIIGYPLGHSMSPMLHTTAFQKLGLPGVLVPWSLEPEKVTTFLEAFKLLDIQGCCVTIPHKKGILPYLDEVTDRVKAVGAANLIYRKGDKICGDNTDVLGFMTPLEQETPAADTRVLLMGAGGAARAAVAGLHVLGIKDITVADIVEDLPAELSKTFNLKRVEWDKRNTVKADMIINATPLGMKGKYDNETGYTKEWFQAQDKPGIAYDIVYTPFETVYQKEAKAAGWKAISGLQMFLSQANHQFKTWTGQDLPEEAKQLVRDTLQGK